MFGKTQRLRNASLHEMKAFFLGVTRFQVVIFINFTFADPSVLLRGFFSVKEGIIFRYILVLLIYPFFNILVLKTCIFAHVFFLLLNVLKSSHCKTDLWFWLPRFTLGKYIIVTLVFGLLTFMSFVRENT